MKHAWMTLLLVGLAAVPGGCKLLGGLYPTATHFRSATVSEQNVAASLDHTLQAILVVLKERQISYSKPERTADSARIFAANDGLEYVFDLSRAGAAKCAVRLEISQFGNEQTAWVMLREVQMIAEASG